MSKSRMISVVMIFLLVVCLIFTYGCKSKSNSDNGFDLSDRADNGVPGYGEETSATSTGISSSTQANESLTDRKVIFSAALEVETTDYDKSIKTMEKMIDDFDGYIQESSVESNTSYQDSTVLREADYTIRIPAGKLKSFISKAGDIGNVVLNNSKGEDVTDTFFDTQAHLETLKIQEERLLALLKKATSLKEILDLEDRISQLRYQIEQLTGTLNHLTSLIDLSTVTIKINEVKEITEPVPEGFWAQVSSTFIASGKALVSTLRVISLIVVAMSPFLITIGLILLVVYIIYQAATRKRRREAKDKKVD